MLGYIFNSCFALTGIVRVRFFLRVEWGAVFSVGVTRELTLVKVFFFRLWGNKAILLGILDSGHIVHFIFLCNKGLYPEMIIFVYIIFRRKGVIWI